MNAPAKRTFEGWISDSLDPQAEYDLTELLGWNPVMANPVIAISAWNTIFE